MLREFMNDLAGMARVMAGARPAVFRRRAAAGCRDEALPGNDRAMDSVVSRKREAP
jgi:hypothetical protein